MAIYIRNTTRLLCSSVRSLATITPSSSTATSPTQVPAEHEGPLRPHFQIPVKPNHGLYGFFRVKTETNSHTIPRDDGQPEYVALEKPGLVLSGRAWNTAELRRKSFRDLHTLWYVLLRERNLLATQGEEKKKVKFPIDRLGSQKALNCRKSMARIKAVVNERRHAYRNASQLRRVLSRNPELSKTMVGTGNESGQGILESEVEQKTQ